MNLKRHYEDCHPDEQYNTLSRKKPKYNRTLRSWKCREHGCCWEGDRLDKHLLNFHKMEKNKVKEEVKIAKKTQQVKITLPKRRSKAVNAEILAKNFLRWFESISGGNFIPDILSEHKQKEKHTQNKRIANNIETLLEEQFGKGSIYPASLICHRLGIDEQKQIHEQDVPLPDDYLV